MSVKVEREQASQETPPEHSPRNQTSLPSRVWRGSIGLWKYFVGVVLCQSALLSVFVVGWCYRLVQRTVFHAWWRASPIAKSDSFASFTGASSIARPHRHWPNWILAQSFVGTLREEVRRPTLSAKVRGAASTFVGSLWQNGKLGVQAILNTWVLTLPGCALWLFAWFAGWNNSFHKGYELAFVGPLAGMLGVGLFIAAMFYLPLAQARQAATGSWRAFYDYRIVRTLARQRPIACVGLAGAYAAASVPLTLLLALPTFFDQIWPDLQNLTDAEALAFLKTYYFRVALIGLPLFVVLKIAAGRVYASAVLSGLRSGALTSDDLAPVERDFLDELQLLQPAAVHRSNFFVRAASWTGRRVERVAACTCLALLWFAFVAQIFIGEFLNYHPVTGWLNQPLVQLPWFAYFPIALGG